MNSLKKLHPQIILGGLFIVLGALFIADNFDLLPFSIFGFIFSWPNILIAIGTVIIIFTSKKNAGGLLVALGLIFQFPQFWPVILIVLGLMLIFRKGRSEDSPNRFFNYSEEKVNLDKIEEIAIFGGSKKTINSPNFQGGEIISVFGGSEIDLTGCILADGEHYLEVTAVFGGTTLYVPQDWNIRLDVTPLFGGFTDSRKKDHNMVFNTSKTLIIRGVVIFGGGEIK